MLILMLAMTWRKNKQVLLTLVKVLIGGLWGKTHRLPFFYCRFRIKWKTDLIIPAPIVYMCCSCPIGINKAYIKLHWGRLSIVNDKVSISRCMKGVLPSKYRFSTWCYQNPTIMCKSIVRLNSLIYSLLTKPQ